MPDLCSRDTSQKDAEPSKTGQLLSRDVSLALVPPPFAAAPRTRFSGLSHAEFRSPKKFGGSPVAPSRKGNRRCCTFYFVQQNRLPLNPFQGALLRQTSPFIGETVCLPYVFSQMRKYLCFLLVRQLLFNLCCRDKREGRSELFTISGKSFVRPRIFALQKCILLA